MTSDAMPTLQPVPDYIPAPFQTLEAAYLAHAAGLRGRLLALSRDPAVADDLVGEAFLRLALEIDAGRPPRDTPAWLYRVGSNLLISRARRNSVAMRALPGLLERDVAPSPEDEIVRRERDHTVRTAVASLGGVDGKIVMLAAQGYRTEEIARIIGCSGPAIRTRLCRARGRLRARLEFAGMTA